MPEFKNLLIVDDSIRDMATRLAVTLDLEIEEALRFALFATTAIIAGSDVSIDELRLWVADAPPLRQCPACRRPVHLCHCTTPAAVGEKALE